MKNNDNRHGKHADGNVLLGGMVEPIKKAVAIVTAAAVAGKGKKLTQTDIIWYGIERLAVGYGVLGQDGKPTEKYSDAIAVALESVIHNNKNNRGTRGGKRK